MGFASTWAELPAGKAALSAGIRPFTTVESYSDHVINPKTGPEDFLTTVPKGQEVVKMPSVELPKPPVPVIDRGGNLVSYMVGLQSESAVLLALKKAGIPME